MPQLGLLYVGLVGLATLLHWLSPARGRPVLIAIVGALMLGSLGPYSLLVLLTLSLCVWVLRNGVLGSWAGASLVAAALILGKCAAESSAWRTAGLLLPVGFGIWSLRLYHYAIDQREGRLAPHGFPEFAAWALFPPTLLVGPIDRFDEHLRDLQRKRWDSRCFAEGLDRLLVGYFKLVVLANWLVGLQGEDALHRFTRPDSPAGVLADSLLYGTHLYLSFAGLSDLAIGWGRLLGHSLPENFNFPFLARTPVDFWRRWHASLGDWCRRYVFLPVHAWTRRPTPAIVATMVVLGAWHQPSLYYLLWGAYHGLGIATYRLLERGPIGKWARCAPTPMRALVRTGGTIMTLAFVTLGFLLTKDNDWDSAVRNLRAFASLVD